MSLSDTALRASIAQQTSEVFLVFATFTHESLDEPIRVVNNNEPIVRSDGTYWPWPFDIEWPENADDSNYTATLTMDNIDTIITRKLDALQGEPPLCTMFEALASSPNNIEFGPIELELQGSSYNQSTMSLSLGIKLDVSNTQYPRRSYLPSNSPSLQF